MSALGVRRVALSLRAYPKPSLHPRGLSSAPAEADADVAPKKPRYKRKNLAEVAAYLPQDGLGARFTRLLWIRNGYEQCYWTIKEIKKNSRGENRFYGRLTWKGVDSPYDRRVNTQCKRGWRFIRDGDDPWSAGLQPKPCLSNALNDAPATQ